MTTLTPGRVAGLLGAARAAGPDGPAVRAADAVHRPSTCSPAAARSVDLAIAAAAAAVMASIDLRDRRSSWTEPQTALGHRLGGGRVPGADRAVGGVGDQPAAVWLLRVHRLLLGVEAARGTRPVRRRGARRRAPWRSRRRAPGRIDSAGAIAALVAVWLINTGVAGTLTWFGWVGEEQHGRRGRELTELTQAHAELERAMQRERRAAAAARGAGA